MFRLIENRAMPLLNSPFVRSVSGMMAYTLIGHSLYMASAPLLGRIYSPEEIGVYGLFFTIAATAAGFVCLLYDFAIPAVDNDQDARSLTVGAALLALIVCPLFAAIIAVLSWRNDLGMGQLPVWAGALMAAILLAQAAIQLAQGWLIRSQQTPMIGKSSISLNVGRGTSQIGVGLLFSAWWALALGELVGRIVSLWHILHRTRLLAFGALPKADAVRSAMARYRHFPAILLPAQGLDAIVLVVQVTGLSMLFGPAALGQYYLMRRTVDLPTAFVFKSLSDVFYGRLAEYARTQPSYVRPFFTKAFLLLLAAGTIGALPVIFYGPHLFRFVYGGEWGEAGRLAAVMMPATTLNLAVAPVSRVFALTSKPYLRLALGFVSAPGTVLVITVAYYWHWSLLATTAGLSAVIALSYLAYFVAGFIASAHIRPPSGVQA